MKKLLNTFALLLISLISCGQAATLINSQSTPRDTTVTNFMYLGAGNRIYVAKQDSLKIRAFQMKWMKDTLTNTTAPYMKITVANDSINNMKLSINTKLTKSDTTGKWRPVSWQPSWSQVTSKPSFSAVATSGLYSDLTGAPNMSSYYLVSNPAGYISTVPAQTWSSITGKPTFSTVATTGAYADLSGKPSIPTVPTNISAFTNDVPYLTSVPAQSFASLSGKPTTLSGYGITDAYPLTGNPSNFLTSVSSGQISTALGFSPYNGTLNPNGFLTSFTETDPLFNTKFSAKSTTDLAEGTKLFYTDTRARGAISLTTTGTGSASYNATTGALNIPTPSTAKRIETYSGVSNSSGVYSVTFPVPFSTTPHIQANIVNQSATNQFIRVSSVSTTGFTVNVFARASLTVLSLELIAAAVTNVVGAPIDVLIIEK